jgi:hypothetical protein
MMKHYVAMRDFTTSRGNFIKTGTILVGDTLTEDQVKEIELQVKSGNVKVTTEGEG